jgi:preprotein translocase subunit SecG
VTIFLTVLHVMVCVVLVVVVLLQHGKGADIGAVFGGGASNTVFGSRGAGNFLTRLTTGAALIFMVTSLVLSYIANTGTGSLFDEDAPPPGVVTPAPSEGEAPAEGAAPGGFEEIPAPEGAEGAAAPESATAPAAEAEAGTRAEAEAEAGAPEAAPAEPAAEAPATP